MQLDVTEASFFFFFKACKLSSLNCIDLVIFRDFLCFRFGGALAMKYRAAAFFF